MRVRAVRWTAFRLPLKRRFVSATGGFAFREGVLVELRTDEGLIGLGEASPLARGRRVRPRELAALFGALAPRIAGRHLEDYRTFFLDAPGADRAALAAVRCAVDTAVCDASARAVGVSVARFLRKTARRSVAVNALIGALPAREAHEAALEARDRGFECVKLKVGMTESADEEAERVAAVREALGPRRELRVDANGAWSVEKAALVIRRIERYRLEFVEQPIAAGDLDGMRRLREAVATPIAADEDVTDVDAARRVIECGAAAVLVVKPMVVGGLRAARQIVDIAEGEGVSVVVTTSVDSGIGTAAALHLAATLPEASPACGLSTRDFLAGDLVVRFPTVQAGRMEVPDGAGLGVELDEGGGALARYGGLTGEALA